MRKGEEEGEEVESGSSSWKDRLPLLASGKMRKDTNMHVVLARERPVGCSHQSPSFHTFPLL